MIVSNSVRYNQQTIELGTQFDNKKSLFYRLTILQISQLNYNIYSQIQELMKLFPENISSFGGISQYESHPAEGPAVNTINPEENYGLRNTQAEDIEALGLHYFQRFTTRGLAKHQISFQKDFLLEHINSFRRLSQNLTEFARSTLQTINPPQNLAPMVDYGHSQQPYTLSALMKTSPLVLSSSDRLIFAKDLSKQSDLESFFNSILTFKSRELVAELVAITISMWKEMRQIDFKNIERKQLLKKADVWSNQHCKEIYNREGFLYVNMKHLSFNDSKSQQLIFDQFSHFFKYFVTTVLFIAGGFFENPYTRSEQAICSDDEVQYPKRELSEDSFSFLSRFNDFSDNEDSFEPKKKLKQ